jgi:perosamine synthetase
MRIPLSAPDINEEDVRAVTEVLRSLRLSLGPKLEEFEEAMARYLGASHAIAVNSGTSGLHLCIRALGIGDGDEVIVPSFAFIAVANVVRYERAVPVFVDIEPQQLNLDPNRIEAAITPRTKAIIAVHTFGCPADMEEILTIARRHHLYVIEDACEALGAEYQGQKVGVLGDAGVFGFYPNKQITPGEGGIVVTQRKEIAKKMRALRNQGRDDSEDWYQHVELGYNYRISEINCALGIEQLRRIGEILERRETIAKVYSHELSGVTELTLPNWPGKNCKISWFVYVVRLGTRFSEVERDQIVREMKSRGIGVGRYFAPIHLQPIYRTEGAARTALPMTESIAPRCLALPFFNQIENEQIKEVCQTLAELLKCIGKCTDPNFNFKQS